MHKLVTLAGEQFSLGTFCNLLALIHSVLDISFVIVYTIVYTIRKRGRLFPGVTASEPGTKLAFNLVLAASCYALLINVTAAIWFPLHCKRFRLRHIEYVAQALAFLIASIALVGTRRSGQERICRIVRVWWGFTSLLTLLPAVLSIILLVLKRRLLSEAWVDMAIFPAAVVFLVASVHPKFVINQASSKDLQEPLLNGIDSGKKDDEGVASYVTASIFSLAMFSWLNPLMAKGAKRPLEPEDLPKLGPRESAATIHDILRENWEKTKEEAGTASPSLVTSLVKTFWKQAAWNAIFVAVNAFASYIGPYLIDDLVEYLAGVRKFPHQGAFLVVVFLGTKVVENFSQRQWYFGVGLIMIQARSALTALVYQKGVRLSSPSRQMHSSGDIVNYMAVDVVRATEFAWYIHDAWVLPLQIILGLAVLYKKVGVAAVATIFATFGTTAFNIPFTRIQEKYEDKIMEAKDVRMRATTECLRSMRILKLQAWEKAYLKKLESLRRTEYGWLKKMFYAQAVVIYTFWSAPVIVGVVTFGCCAALKVPLTTGKVLSALSTFRVLQEPLSSFPDCVSAFAQARVSLQRLSSFLFEEELQDDAVVRVPKAAADDDGVGVKVEDGVFSWDGSIEKITLQDINFQAKEGGTIAVCGMVGSGKSSLISCLLGEIPKLAGQVKVKGTTAYVGQTAWIQSGKIQDNVLFGSPMDKAKYDNVLETCQLKKDLEVLPYGDQTEIGERGINLSGGQKQRIQLARAVYQDADVYLLDDPFSAVDVQTGTEIFREVVLGALATKTVILVTHQVEFLPAADMIVVLKDGRISQCGTFHELLNTDADFSVLVNAHNKALEVIDKAGKDAGDARDVDNTVEDILDDDEKSSKKKEENKEMMQLVQEEERERGSVGLHVYWIYCTALYNGALFPVMVACHATYQGLQIAGNWWMAKETPATVLDRATVGPTKLILVYTAFTFGGSLFVLLRVAVLNIIGLGTSQIFFYNMLRCIFHAPMSFFDATPTGRILNRASTDQSALDMTIPYRLAGLANSAVQLLSVAGVMSQALWQVLIAFVPVCVLCIMLQRYYITSARELARLTGIQKAPIIHHYSESIAGAPTVRGFNQEERFVKRNLCLIDNHTRPVFYSSTAMEWVTLRLEFLSNIVFSSCLVLLVCFPNAVEPSLAGLAVSYGLNLNGIQAWFIWNLCNVENKIISVERIQQYTCIPSEAAWEIEEAKPPESWPSEGTVELRDLQIRYTDTSPLVLHGITCTFPGGKKVGVVGRTGSGKSTLIQAIFRIIEPAGGTIVIDGVDITRIGLHDLRSRLSIIPQDPTLFEGTVRYNLDPLGQHSDSELWEALDKCQLGDLVRNKAEKLDAAVSDNGENWSVGQRQLFCLGRVMLKRARVLVLDEATASVDSATDGLIQSTITRQFSGCTIITIAHRLPTVIDSDLVLVLSDGRIAEFDNASKLLENPASHFFKLVNEYSKRTFH